MKIDFLIGIDMVKKIEQTEIKVCYINTNLFNDWLFEDVLIEKKKLLNKLELLKTKNVLKTAENESGHILFFLNDDSMFTIQKTL